MRARRHDRADHRIAAGARHVAAVPDDGMRGPQRIQRFPRRDGAPPRGRDHVPRGADGCQRLAVGIHRQVAHDFRTVRVTLEQIVQRGGVPAEHEPRRVLGLGEQGVERAR